ncbi:hypothetical protein BHM03_00006567 [Ensete ventricosum]|nr:hypothetical protein BHM03_00006567 [Ensete ventricosum]
MASSPSSVSRWTRSQSLGRPRATAGDGDLDLHGFGNGGEDVLFPFGDIPSPPPLVNRSPRHDVQHVTEEVGNGSLVGHEVIRDAGESKQGVLLTWGRWCVYRRRIAKGGVFRSFLDLSVVVSDSYAESTCRRIGIWSESKRRNLDQCPEAETCEALCSLFFPSQFLDHSGEVLFLPQAYVTQEDVVFVLPSQFLDHSGEVLFLPQAYVTQEDVVMTTPTVREAVYDSGQLQLPDSMTRSDSSFVILMFTAAVLINLHGNWRLPLFRRRHEGWLVQILPLQTTQPLRSQCSHSLLLGFKQDLWKRKTEWALRRLQQVRQPGVLQERVLEVDLSQCASRRAAHRRRRRYHREDRGEGQPPTTVECHGNDRHAYFGGGRQRGLFSRQDEPVATSRSISTCRARVLHLPSSPQPSTHPRDALRSVTIRARWGPLHFRSGHRAGRGTADACLLGLLALFLMTKGWLGF